MDYAKRLYRHFMQDSLHRSSSFLMLSSGIGALFGFCFWLICARLTSSVQIGYATSLIAYSNLFSTVVTLGLPNAVIRFLPNHEKRDEYLGTVLSVTLACSVVLGIVLTESIKYFSPGLQFAVVNPEIFWILVVFLVANSIGSIASAGLLAQKNAKSIFIMALWQYPLRVIVPFMFVNLGLKDILMITTGTTLVGTIYQLYVLYRGHHYKIVIRLSSLTGSLSFTLGNLAGTIFGIMPSTLVPIIVLNRLGPSLAACFYIAMQFASVLGIICSSSAQALLSEASHDNNPKKYMHHFIKSLKNMYSLLIPAALLLAIVGTQLLRIYGNTYYSHGEILLILLCVASLFVGVNWLGDSLLNVQKRPFAYGAMNFVNATIVIIAVYEFASRGLAAVGYGWIMAQITTVLIYLFLQYRFLKTYWSKTAS